MTRPVTGAPFLLTLTTFIAAATNCAAGTIFNSGLGSCPGATADQAQFFHIVPVSAPSIRTLGPIQFAGINVYAAAESATFFSAVGAAWANLPAVIPSIPSKTNEPFSSSVALGYYNFAPCFSVANTPGLNFMPSVAVTSFNNLPSDVSGVQLAANQYAVFTYTGLAEGLGNFRFSINEVYWPSSTLRPLDLPNLEVYAPDYDPASPTATAEVWVAIAAVPEPSQTLMVLVGGAALLLGRTSCAVTRR